jgi:hypothetical protein
MIQTESRFEDRLLAELKQVVAARAGTADVSPARVHPTVKRRRLALVGAFGAVGAVASLVFAVTPGGGIPAYAVSRSADGTVTVTANYLGDPTQANRELRRAGVRAVVLPAVPAASCPAGDQGRKVPAEKGGQGTTILVTHMVGSKQVQVRWQLDSIVPGALLVLSPQRDEATGDMVMTVDEYYEPGPRCVVQGTKGLVPVPP